MYRTVINLEFFKIPSMSGFRNRNIDTRSRQYIAEAGCQWKKVKSTKKKREREHRGKRGNMKKKTWSQSGRTKRSAYKFAVEFAFPSSGNFRSRPAFLYDHRISNLREISGAMLFQRFRGFPVLDFNGGAGRARKFFYLSLYPSSLLAFLFMGRILRWTFSIRFRFTATQKEVVRFSTFESMSLPHEESEEIPQIVPTSPEVKACLLVYDDSEKITQYEEKEY